MFEIFLVILAAVGVFLMYNALSAFGGPALQPPAKPKATNVKGAGVAKKKPPTKAELAAEKMKKQRDEELIARELSGVNKGLGRDAGSSRPLSLDEYKKKLADKAQAAMPSAANAVVDTEKARNQAKAQGFKLIEEDTHEVSQAKKQRLKKIADAQAAYASQHAAGNELRESRRKLDENDLNTDRNKKVEEKAFATDWQIMSRKEILDRKLSKFFKGGRKAGSPRVDDQNAPKKVISGDAFVNLKKNNFNSKTFWKKVDPQAAGDIGEQ